MYKPDLHWITYNGWYAIKPNQTKPLLPDNLTANYQPFIITASTSIRNFSKPIQKAFLQQLIGYLFRQKQNVILLGEYFWHYCFSQIKNHILLSFFQKPGKMAETNPPVAKYTGRLVFIACFIYTHTQVNRFWQIFHWNKRTHNK